MTDRNDATPLLRVLDLHGWYGESHVLHGMEFFVRAREVITLIGRNGVGKSTTLKAIMGLLPKRRGSIELNGKQIIKASARAIALSGIGYCPEDRGIFSALSVQENLLLPRRVGSGGLSDDDIFGMFPNLRERLYTPGSKLSGGEQQMLALARIMRTGASLLILDEPTEGLAPVIVKQIHRTVQTLKQMGFTIILVEQNLKFALDVADRHYVVEHGAVVDAFDRDDAHRQIDKLHSYLGA